MKKLLSIILVALLMVTLVVPSFAAEGNGVIMIKNALPEQEYSIYRIFDLESYDNERNAYVYKINSDWIGFEKVVPDYFSVNNKTRVVNWIAEINSTDVTRMQIFARRALNYANLKNIQPVDTKIAPASKSKGVELIFNIEKLGYYLINSNYGILCSLNTSDPNIEIEEKNDPIILKKNIIDNNGLVCKNPTFSVGDVIDFEINIVLSKEKVEDVVIHDKMSDGLELVDESIEVFVNDKIIDLNNYDIIRKTGGDCTFEVEFVKKSANNSENLKDADNKDDNFSLNPGDAIKVKYKTQVTSAYKSEYGLQNKAYVLGKPYDDITITKMLKIQIIKTDKNSKKGVYNILTGATFSLYEKEKSTTPLEFMKMEDGSFRLVEDGYEGKRITEIPAGTPIIEGLSGEYWLEEVKAPEGYKPMQGRLKINVEKDNLAGDKAIVDGKYYSNISGGIHVMNEKAPNITLTGSVGTVIIYSVGGILLVLGCVFLIVLIKRKDDKE